MYVNQDSALEKENKPSQQSKSNHFSFSHHQKL